MTSIRSAGLRHVLTPPFLRRVLLITAVLCVAALATPQAQDPPAPTDDIPAHIAIVDGNATLDRDGGTDPAQTNDPLLAGDRLRTDRGRAEVLFGDGSALDLDEYTTVEFASDSLMRLRTGRVRLSVVRGVEAIDYRVDAAAAALQIRTPGEYRLALQDSRSTDPQVTVDVLIGSAELSNALGRTLVRAGMQSVASSRAEPSLPSPSYLVEDEFDRWSDDQRDARTGAASARYLPDDLRYYSGSLDRAGSWGYEAGYGDVWYPRVEASWQPYYDGSWTYYGSFGWTWIGLEAWSWPTHHFGRWGLRGSRWFWIPDRYWAPAWVSWAYAPGYVSWCPLGRDNRALFDLGFGGRGFDARFGWNVAPARAFAPRVLVSRYAIARPSLAPAVWSQFERRDSGPAWRTASTAAPLRSPRAAIGRTVTRDARAPIGGPAPRDFSARSTPTRRLDSGSATLGASSRPALADPRRVSGPRAPAVSAAPGRAPDNQGAIRSYSRGRQPEVTSPTAPRQYSTDRQRTIGREQTPPTRSFTLDRQAPASRSYSIDRRGPASSGPPPNAGPPPQPSGESRSAGRSAPRFSPGGGGPSSGHGAPPSASSHGSSSSGSSGGSGRQAPAGSEHRGNSGRRGGGR